jgi:hypothetical protein
MRIKAVFDEESCRMQTKNVVMMNWQKSGPSWHGSTFCPGRFQLCLEAFETPSYVKPL